MVTLNSDMGESFGIHTFGNDDRLVGLVDTVNVACGFHAGDPVGIHETVAKALAGGVTVGAHPGLPDLVGFGRREMKLFPDEAADIVRYQVGALVAFLKAEGGALDHIKAHGSLYGMSSRDPELAEAIATVAAEYEVPIFGIADSEHEKAAQNLGVPFVAEFYVDLGYRADGSLIVARRPHATPVAEATERARKALVDGIATAVTGEEFAMRVDSICVHSDTPNAVEIAQAVRDVLSAV
ncbi:MULTISPECIES: 5-oxoprolinase subunit PxpA [Nocardia]|uniref:5-oxoprolinase subunit PxpA n=2 Tax=Nocardiaceae TaxID=85025 RepID=UPI000BF0E1F0|nr:MULTISPECIES: 5-oxoprolinase subunit PxpA [Nocardia]MBF6185683.1 LamB/YcsF family protein [Nocardia farcinica]MBF6311528.1 LamB/YcsF family protein [Nocardia farcinica]MBF6408512.1 LamB/YcsF family protein [Nocardia farcinica]PEH76731.1 lactam utilization protein LamB [Nocardia sp. FDAARGOS_372]UEX21124.1 LamB/YcsF family protein [Nocardia farcinica]